MDSDADSDVSMHTAPSRTPSPLSAVAPGVMPMVLDEPDEPVISEPSLDLLSRLPGMYRLLDLVQERGSGGVVDKIIIAQDSIKAFANKTHPGSYRSDIQVDFKALDDHVIKPRGIYGSTSAIVDFLDSVGCMTDEARSLLLRHRDDSAGITSSTLRPGLYLVDPINDQNGSIYIVFWPEDGTWEDGAISSVSRNRVTFMRYLTKLCDQLDCLISDEHSAQLVWKDGPNQNADEDAEYSSFDGRMVGYTVEQTKEEEESALTEEGFVIQHRSIEEIDKSPSGYPYGNLDILQPRLIGGETNQAILESHFIPEEIRPVRIDGISKTMALRDMLTIKKNPTVILKEHIDFKSLQIVLEHGLWERCGDLQSEWKSRKAMATASRERDQIYERNHRIGTMAGEKSVLESGIVFWMAKQAATFYPLVPEHRLFQDQLPDNTQISEGECETAIAKINSWLEHRPKLSASFIWEVTNSFQTLGTNTSTRYSH